MMAARFLGSFSLFAFFKNASREVILSGAFGFRPNCWRFLAIFLT